MELEKEPKDAPLNNPEEKEAQPTLHTLLYDIKQTILQLDKAIAGKESRQIYRLTKQVRRYKSVIQAHHLEKVFNVMVPDHGISFAQYPNFNREFAEAFELPKNILSRISKIPELEIYPKMLLIIFLMREKLNDNALSLIKPLLAKIYELNRRGLDSFNANLYYYYTRIHEHAGSDLTIRQELLEAFNRACLKNDEIGQATLLNLILRNYVNHNHIEAAQNFMEKTKFPEAKSNNEYCKYLFYVGKVKAIRRNYQEALSSLNEAIRKAPDRAYGFKIQCQRYAIVVELLLGDIPNREIFSEEIIFKHTYGYYKVIQAVLNGNLSVFNEVVAKYKDRFTQDKLYTLIMRLNQIVIRVGLRKINSSYSRISLEDIADKLKIDKQDVEFVVAKAIRDGVLMGEINRETRIVVINEQKHVYMTNEPQVALNKRIAYCLKLYQSIQKAITYPDTKLELERNDNEGDIDPNELVEMLDFEDDM